MPERARLEVPAISRSRWATLAPAQVPQLEAKGAARSTKGGLGSSLISLPGGKLVGCIVVVNAVGEVRDPSSGSTLAGIRGDNRGEFLSSVEAITGGLSSEVLPGTNTTIAAIVTNVSMTKTQLTKVAQMAHDGMARAINPVHTQFDGDTVFAASTKTSPIDSELSPADTVNQIGTAAAEALAQAIILAVKHAFRQQATSQVPLNGAN